MGSYLKDEERFLGENWPSESVEKDGSVRAVRGHTTSGPHSGAATSCPPSSAACSSRCGLPRDFSGRGGPPYALGTKGKQGQGLGPRGRFHSEAPPAAVPQPVGVTAEQTWLALKVLKPPCPLPACTESPTGGTLGLGPLHTQRHTSTWAWMRPISCSNFLCFCSSLCTPSRSFPQSRGWTRAAWGGMGRYRLGLSLAPPSQQRGHWPQCSCVES